MALLYTKYRLDPRHEVSPLKLKEKIFFLRSCRYAEEEHFEIILLGSRTIG
jgi:hypothetical protein